MKRNILVTGANRGIGLAIVKELSQNSANTVLLGCRNVSEGEILAKQLASNVKVVEVDLSNREQLKICAEKILNDFQKIDVLINNAGILNEGSFTEVSLEKFDEAIRVNTIAPYELIRYFIPSMKNSGYGRIVNVSSGWGSFEDGLTGPFSYSFSKAALNALTLSVSKDLPSNIKINSMCPGWVKTRMGGDNATRTPEVGAKTAVWLANLDENGPSGGFFRDEESIGW